MNNFAFTKDLSQNSHSRDLRRLFVHGFMLRLFVLMLVFAFEGKFTRYYMNDGTFHDDEKYTQVALEYAQNASGIIDYGAFVKACNNAYYNVEYSRESFWFWFVAVLGYISGGTFVIHLAIIFMSVMTIRYVYLLGSLLYGDKVGYFGARLYTYMPYPVIFSAFIFKDQAVSLLVIIICYYIMRFSQFKKFRAQEVLIILLSLYLIQSMRSGLAEVLLFIYIVSIAFIRGNVGAYRWHRIFKYGVLIVSATILAANIDPIYTVVSEKISNYLVANRYADSTISFVSVESFSDLYKLPFAYMVSILMPSSLGEPLHSWISITGYLNIVHVPIATGLFIYMFMYKKRNFTFYTLITLLYFGTIVLSLGIFRHHYYLLPFTYIFFSQFKNISRRISTPWILLSGALLVVLVFI